MPIVCCLLTSFLNYSTMKVEYTYSTANAYYYYLCHLLQSCTEDPCYSVYSTISPNTVLNPVFLYNFFIKLHTSPEVYILSLMYLNQFFAQYPELFNVQSISSLVFVSIMVSQKYHEETNYNMLFYSSISSLPPAVICDLESDFLKRLDYSLYISCDEYTEFYNQFYQFSTSISQSILLPRITSSFSQDRAVITYKDTKHCLAPNSYVPLSIPLSATPIVVTNVALLPSTPCIIVPPNGPFVETFSPTYAKSCSLLPFYREENNLSDHSSTHFANQQSCYPTIQPLSYVFTQVPVTVVNCRQYRIPHT